MSTIMRSKALFAIVVVALTLTPATFAESWPTLDEYVSKCMLIVKARATEDPDKNGMRTFEVLESWKGKFDPAAFAPGMATGQTVRARQGEHGVEVTQGQEIILFYTRHNQPDDKLHAHSTAFPIVDGKIVYASTGEAREEMTVEVFKKRVAAIRASTQPTDGSTTKPAAPGEK